MGLFGKKETPLYKGQTYRRQVVSDISAYSSAWRGGDSAYTVGSDYKASGYTPGTGGAYRGQDQPVYNSARLTTNSLYRVDDGSYLQNQEVLQSGRGNLGATNQPNTYSQLGVSKNESNAIVRYVEDPNGDYGVTGYDGQSPTGFASLRKFDIQSTSKNAAQKAAAAGPRGEPVSTSISQTAKKRKSSVGTSKFKIDIGGTTRSSGLGIPT